MTNGPKLVALGDCNTLGVQEVQPVAYPHVLGRALGVRVVNCGHTMSTVREGWEYALREITPDTAYLTLQFGLVDSWLTVRWSPYVLNYPDNPTRRIWRKLVKKYKKISRWIGLRKLLGETNVVGIDEFRDRLTAIIRLARERTPQVDICLIGAPPSLDLSRNGRLQNYNAALGQVAAAEGCRMVDGYSPFDGRADFYHDHVHLNAAGHEIVARLCADAFRTPFARSGYPHASTPS